MRRKKQAIVQFTTGGAVIVLAGLLLAACLGQWRERTVDERVEQYRSIIEANARRQNLPVELIWSVVRAESGGDPRAVSRTGARGLMQLMPDAEKDACRKLGVPTGDLFDAEHNITVGSAYLRMMLDRFGGDVYLAMAAYNWGPGNVEKARREHPELSSRQLVADYAPAQTSSYCETIIRDRWGRLPVLGRSGRSGS